VRNEVLAQRLREILRLSINSSFSQLPSLYLQSDADRLVASSALDDFKSQVKSLTVHKLPGPHFLLQANSSECAEVLEEFLSKLELL